MATLLLGLPPRRALNSLLKPGCCCCCCFCEGAGAAAESHCGRRGACWPSGLSAAAPSPGVPPSVVCRLMRAAPPGTPASLGFRGEGVPNWPSLGSGAAAGTPEARGARQACKGPRPDGWGLRLEQSVAQQTETQRTQAPSREQDRQASHGPTWRDLPSSPTCASSAALGEGPPPCERTGTSARKGWRSSVEASGRAFQSRLKHRYRKSLHSGERCCGISGGPFDEAMWNMAATCRQSNVGAGTMCNDSAMPRRPAAGTAPPTRVPAKGGDEPSQPTTEVAPNRTCYGSCQPVPASPPGWGTGCSRAASRWPSPARCTPRSTGRPAGRAPSG